MTRVLGPVAESGAKKMRKKKNGNKRKSGKFFVGRSARRHRCILHGYIYFSPSPHRNRTYCWLWSILSAFTSSPLSHSFGPRNFQERLSVLSLISWAREWEKALSPAALSPNAFIGDSSSVECSLHSLSLCIGPGPAAERERKVLGQRWEITIPGVPLARAQMMETEMAPRRWRASLARNATSCESRGSFDLSRSSEITGWQTKNKRRKNKFYYEFNKDENTLYTKKRFLRPLYLPICHRQRNISSFLKPPMDHLFMIIEHKQYSRWQYAMKCTTKRNRTFSYEFDEYTEKKIT